MNDRRQNTNLIFAASLFQLCFVLVESLILAYPAMYLFAYPLSKIGIGDSVLGWLFAPALIGVIALPVLVAVQAWSLLGRGRRSGWYLSAALDTVLALACAALTLSLYESPPSGHAAWDLMSVMIALPLAHLAVITSPFARRRLVVQLS